MALITKFHLLILAVTIATAGVIIFRVPADFAFPAHWQGSGADWLWPRNPAIAVAPLVELLLIGGFWMLGRALTPGHLARVRHVLDPALTLALAIAFACQLALLLVGVGADIDLFRITAGVLAAVFLITGIVLFEAERHTYAGLRLPWPIPGDRAWRRVHRSAGGTGVIIAVALAVVVWLDPGPGITVLAMVASLVLLPTLSALYTMLLGRLPE